MKRTIKLLTSFVFFCSLLHTNAQIQSQPNNNSLNQQGVNLIKLVQDKDAQNVSYIITAQHTSRTSGIHHMYLRQAVNGIEIIGTESSIHKTQDGTIVKKHNSFVKDIDTTVKNTSPGISSSQAINGVAQQMGYTISSLQEIERKGTINQEKLYNKAGISVSDIPVKLAYLYQQGLGTTLVWQLSVEEIDSTDWWEFIVNASTGAIISQLNYTVSCFTEEHNHNANHGVAHTDKKATTAKPAYKVANNTALMVGSYNVIAMPDESPQHGSAARQVVVNPDNAIASPFGWHDTNGIAGAESNYTIGNNTDAYDDRTSSTSGSGSGVNSERAFGDTGLVFNDPFNTDVTAAGTNGSIFAAVTNLFYWANIIHDVSYLYGFDEAAGNFQENNYGNGGIGGDSVRSEAQDGSGTCNANFSTPADGARGRMQMYVCNSRDGDFDNGVIAHEYGHGISTRLTGGASNSGCLNSFSTPEQMGEGWSDFYGLLLTMETGDSRADARGIGTWLVGQGPNDVGIRPTPYSTDFAVNGSTYSTLPSVIVPHGVGYVWATMLWELTWDLIDDQGFDTDFYTGSGGNNIALNLVTEGMKFQPCSPGFVDGRDGILAADIALYGGAYSCIIWEAFARRGLGYSASQGNSSSISDGSEAFDLPPGLGSPSLDTIGSSCITNGTQSGLGGGTPTGGVYSGIGVTDDANGTTYTFDPAVNGVGSVVVSYSLTNICTSASEIDTDTIVVGDGSIALVCPADITSCSTDINYDFPRPSDGCFGRSANELNQNNTETINSGIDCPSDTSGHLRRFNLTTEGVVRDYLVTGIDVGINSTTGANIIVNIYLDNTIDNAITTYRVPISDVVTPYASVTSAVPSGSNFVHSVPFDLFLPAATAFTVEVISPASQDFMIGYNNSGVTNDPDATAIAYTSCLSNLDYSDLSTVSTLGGNAVLIKVQGTESDTLTTTQTTGLTTGEIFPFGTTTNTFETTDGTNTVSCSFDVNVVTSNCVSWTGVANTSWNNTSNWSTGVIPASSDVVVIDGAFTNEPILSNTDQSVQSVYIAEENSLTIDQTSSLTVSGNFTNSGTVTLNSTQDDFSSLIVEGTATGNVVYNRYVNAYSATAGGGWDGTGPPVAMSIADFISDNTGVIYQVGDTYALGPFNNLTNQYEYYTTTTGPSAGAFTAAKGYTMATTNTNGATVKYTGTLATTTQSIDVINNNDANGGVGRRWNFVSNPFPSYINGNTNAAAVNNFLDVNSGVLDATYTGVYGWNGSSYDIYNQLDGAFSIAPGQGFFVAAASSSNTALDFTPAMRTTNGSGDFILGPQPLVYKLELKLFNGEMQKAKTNIYFKNGLSLDLDPGYDAGAYNQSKKISTRLPQGSQETAFARNAMGMEAMQNTRVPLEIRQNAGQAFRVSMAEADLPQDINVYLEDTLNGTLTSLKDGDFELVAQSNLSGVDRFFIVFKSNSVLSSGDTLAIKSLDVYKANTENFVTICGITPDLEQLKVTLYNILGMTVREKALNPTTPIQTISTQGLAGGLYIVQVRSENQIFNKKVIVK